MAITVGFESLDFGIVAPGQTPTQTTQSGRFSGPVSSLTASIVGDANHVFSVVSVTVYSAAEFGASLHGGESVTSTQVAQSNGVTPLSVGSGGSVTVTVQFAPTASTPYKCTATVEVNGTGLSPASIPLSASIGEVSVSVPAITVALNQKATVTVTVTLIAGPPTTATLAVGPSPALPERAPAGFVVLSPTSVPISSGEPATCVLTVDPSVLTEGVDGAITGTYQYALSGTTFDGAYPLEATINITVEQSHYFIKSKLGDVISIAHSSTRSGAGLVVNPKVSPDYLPGQLWAFLPDPAGSGCYYIVSKLNGNVIDIQEASTKAGALLDAFPRKSTEDGQPGSDNQLWYFVTDPQYPSYCRIVSKLNGNVIDVEGGSTTAGTPIDSFPVKLTVTDNQLWEVINGEFPDALNTVPYPADWGSGNVNYLMDGGSEALASVSVTVEFSQDFSSASNGYGFQLNCYSSSDATTIWQQFAIYGDPDDGNLHAIIETWTPSSSSTSTIPNTQVNNIDVVFANLPNLVIPAGYVLTIALTYYQEPQNPYPYQRTVIVDGAIFTVTDNTGRIVGTTTIGILGQTLKTTSQPATLANLAPVTNIQFNIVGDNGGNAATLTQGAGKISYNASSNAGSGLTVTQSGQPGPFSVFGTFTDTGENANVRYGPLPWPWFPSMNTGSQYVQLFEVVPVGSTAPWVV